MIKLPTLRPPGSRHKPGMTILSVLFCLITLSACQVTGTRYTSYQPDSQGAHPALDRTVQFQLSDAFYREAPDCVVIAPTGHAAGLEVETSLQRHLALRIDRVIGPRERARFGRENALDFSVTGDWYVFAAQSRCRYVLDATPWRGGDTFAFVWSEKRIGMELALRKIGNEEVLWQARHEAQRSEGGLPLSPFSAGWSALSAARFEADEDVTPSMIDDAVRRMMKTLPDIRL